MKDVYIYIIIGAVLVLMIIGFFVDRYLTKKNTTVKEFTSKINNSNKKENQNINVSSIEQSTPLDVNNINNNVNEKEEIVKEDNDSTWEV